MSKNTQRANRPITTTNLFSVGLVTVLWLFVWIVFQPQTYVGKAIYWLALYLLVLAALSFLRANKIGRFFFRLFALPGIAFITVFPFLIAAASVLLSYTIIFFISMIFFQVMPIHLFNYHPTKEVTIYLEITTSSIVVAYFYDKVVGFLDYIIFHRGVISRKRFSLKILNQSRAKFSIYFLYFLALLIVHTSRFAGIPIIASESIEKAILESFGTFLAFERITSNWSLFIEEKGKRSD